MVRLDVAPGPRPTVIGPAWLSYAGCGPTGPREAPTPLRDVGVATVLAAEAQELRPRERRGRRRGEAAHGSDGEAELFQVGGAIRALGDVHLESPPCRLREGAVEIVVDQFDEVQTGELVMVRHRIIHRSYTLRVRFVPLPVRDAAARVDYPR
jgi:hypothetical protein